MLEALKANVFGPAATRLGTLVTGALVGIGANATHADWVGTGIAGAFLIGMDFLLAYMRKRSIQKKAVASVTTP